MDVDLSNDPIALLMDDHQRVAELFDTIASTAPGERTPLVEMLGEMLTTHMALEERHLYPVVKEKMGAEESEEAFAEHGLAKEGLEKLKTLLPDKPGFDGALESLRAGIVHHVEEEEGEIFPELEQSLDEEQMRRLADALA